MLYKLLTYLQFLALALGDGCLLITGIHPACKEMLQFTEIQPPTTDVTRRNKCNSQ